MWALSVCSLVWVGAYAQCLGEAVLWAVFVVWPLRCSATGGELGRPPVPLPSRLL
ncbi:hypothetical protein BD309DRAFT_955813, partial [Dichomitus squalens]